MRLSPTAVWRAHLRGLTKHPTGRPDVFARTAVYGLPVLVAVLAYVLEARLRQAGVLLAGASLLAGTLLASFGQLATLRGKISERIEVRRVALDALDETTAHVLVAVYAAILLAATLGTATSLTAGAVYGLAAALALGLGAWLLLLVLLIVPRLYQAYTYAFDVSPELDGYQAGSLPQRNR
jgi:hypothetical protein